MKDQAISVLKGAAIAAAGAALTYLTEHFSEIDFGGFAPVAVAVFAVAVNIARKWLMSLAAPTPTVPPSIP